MVSYPIGVFENGPMVGLGTLRQHCFTGREGSVHESLACQADTGMGRDERAGGPMALCGSENLPYQRDAGEGSGSIMNEDERFGRVGEQSSNRFLPGVSSRRYFSKAAEHCGRFVHAVLRDTDKRVQATLSQFENSPEDEALAADFQKRLRPSAEPQAVPRGRHQRHRICPGIHVLIRTTLTGLSDSSLANSDTLDPQPLASYGSGLERGRPGLPAARVNDYPIPRTTRGLAMNGSPGQNGESGRIAFYARRSFHSAILAPVYEQLRRDFTCLLTADRDSVVDFSPRIVLMADAYSSLFREDLPQTVCVWMRHGFSSKNYLAQCVRGCDFACVTSEWTITELRDHGILPHLGFWATGFVPMDPVFRGEAALPDNIEKQLGPGPTLLYAPTYEPALSSAPMLGSVWISQVRQLVPSLNVIIKPHPGIPDANPEWIAMWREVAAQGGAILTEASDSVYTYFPATDVLLTDASSTMFYFLAMDRPIVLVSNPRRFGHPHFDSDGPEWTWRDMGTEIEHVEQLPEALLHALANPTDRAAERAGYRRRVFGSLTDGRAAERVASRVRALIRPAERDREWVDIVWQSMATTGRLRREAMGLKRQLRRTVDQRARQAARAVLRKVLPGWSRRDSGVERHGGR